MATAHTDAVIRRMNARVLANAITRMADRYAESDRKSVRADSMELDYRLNGNAEKAAEKKAESERHDRAALRRRAAVARLTTALVRMATE